MRKLISVALAAWRGEQWIGMQLESLLHQSRRPDEIVICDDSPDDATERAVAPFLQTGGVIRYMRNERQLGIVRNFQKALQLCTGDLLFLADQDDVWDSDKVAILAEFLEREEACDLVFCDSRVVDAGLREMGHTAWELQGFDRRWLEETPEKWAARMLIRPTAYAHDMAFRREILAWSLPFPEMETGACHDFWLSSLAAVRGRLQALPRCLTSYRCHGGNFTVVKRSGWLERWRYLRRNGREELRRSAMRYEALVQHLDAVPEVLPGLRKLCEDLAEYYRLRAEGGVPSAAAYRRFGAGWKSRWRDCLLPR